MTEDIPSQQLQIDPLLLQQIVRQDQDDQTFEILSVTSSSLSNQGLMSPEGLVLVKGEGRGKCGICTWAVVLKKVEFITGDIPGMAEDSQRELRLAQVGMFDLLPGPIVAPCIYHVVDSQTGGEIWMEYMQDASPRVWGLDDFVFAAKEIARFNVAYLNQTASNTFQHHLAHNFLRSWFKGLTTIPDERVWSNPYVQKFVTADLRARYEDLIADQDRFFRTIDHLPHLFLHNDLHRRNLMVRSKGDHRQLVALDWSVCTMGPLGADLSALIGASCFLYEMDPANLADFAPVIYEAYMDGLYTAGWQGDPAQVRLGTTAWMAMHNNIYPAVIALWTSDATNPDGPIHFGRGPNEYVPGWVGNFRYFLDLADEARSMML